MSLGPFPQVRQERIGTDESRELRVALLPAVPVIENQCRRPESPKRRSIAMSSGVFFVTSMRSSFH